MSYTKCKPKNKNARGLGTRLLFCLKCSNCGPIYPTPEPNTSLCQVLKPYVVVLYMVCSLPSRSPEDTEGHEYVVLDAVINVIKDTKKHYAFCLCCKGLSEMYFGADNEDTFMDWLSRLNAASKLCDRGELYTPVRPACMRIRSAQYKTLTH